MGIRTASSQEAPVVDAFRMQSTPTQTEYEDLGMYVYSCVICMGRYACETGGHSAKRELDNIQRFRVTGEVGNISRIRNSTSQVLSSKEEVRTWQIKMGIRSASAQEAPVVDVF